MNYVFFLNSQRGLFILKKLNKSKKFNLNKAVICNKSIAKKLKNIISKPLAKGSSVPENPAFF